MMQLNLTARGDSPEEILFHVIKMVRQMHGGTPAGRTDAVRRDGRGRDVLTNMGHYDLRYARPFGAPTAAPARAFVGGATPDRSAVRPGAGRRPEPPRRPALPAPRQQPFPLTTRSR